MSMTSDRRQFLKASLGAGVGIALARPGGGTSSPPTADSTAYRPPTGFAAPPLETVRIGLVGVGLQGGWHVKNFLGIEGVEIRAICDIDAPRAAEVAAWVTEKKHSAPDLYTRGETDYKRLCERDDIDLVFSSTPWDWHVPVCVEAMESGKHAAVEVPAAITLEGCWQLVETAERERRHCVMMENCNYGRSELMVLRMVREGLFGELLHAEGAYIHDLRAIKLDTKSEGLWRWKHSARRNGNLYPTHGLGPLAQCLDIHRGDRFDYLVSMSSPARGLSEWARENLPVDDPRREIDFKLGNMNSSLVKTVSGKTILVQHDTTTPRPYSRIHLLQGTKATFSGYPDRVFIEGRQEGHEWEEAETYRERYDHPLWRELEKKAEGARHGGMDYLEDYRLIECLRRGEPTDMDVYDAAALSAISECSERSVADRSRPIDIPDFTRGTWRYNQSLGVVGG